MPGLLRLWDWRRHQPSARERTFAALVVLVLALVTAGALMGTVSGLLFLTLGH